MRIERGKCGRACKLEITTLTGCRSGTGAPATAPRKRRACEEVGRSLLEGSRGGTRASSQTRGAEAVRALGLVDGGDGRFAIGDIAMSMNVLKTVLGGTRATLLACYETEHNNNGDEQDYRQSQYHSRELARWRGIMRTY